jgi:hypothetical protein
MLVHVARAASVWDERPFASVQVGIGEKNHAAIYRVITLGAVGPESGLPTPELSDIAKQCVARSASVAAHNLGRRLDDELYAFNDIEQQVRATKRDVNADTLKSQLTELQNRSANIFHFAHEEFRLQLSLCLRSGSVQASQFRLGFAIRLCEPTGIHACSVLLRADGGRGRFEKLVEWLRPAGYIVTNRWATVQDSGKPVYEPPPIELQPIQSRWPAEPDPNELLSLFERYAVDSKARNTTISYAAPSLMRLTIVQGSQVISVINAPGRVLAQLSPTGAPLEKVTYDAPANAALRGKVVSQPWPKTEFASWSDEVARTRIKECASFRGISEATRLGECAGYQIDAPKVLSCLTGGQCIPQPGGKVYKIVEALIDKNIGRNLATEIPAPRIMLPKYGDYLSSASKCLDDNRSNPDQATICLVKAGAGDKARSTLECIDKLRKKESSAKLDECLLTSVSDPQGKQLAGCLLSVNTDPQAAVACTLAGSLPESTRKIITCMYERRTSADALSTAACAVGNNNQDQQLALRCLRVNSGWSGAAVCTLRGKAALPPTVSTALDCATKAGVTLASFAGCTVSKNVTLPGDFGRLATCAAANAGSTFGTAACMTSNKLTPEQQIALQCAAYSAGVATYAICTGGLLAFKEFDNCKHEKFGSNKCFGENNEIRKFFRNVLGQDIHSDTVVGQIINVPLEVIKFVANTPPIQITKIGGTRVCLPWC